MTGYPYDVMLCVWAGMFLSSTFPSLFDILKLSTSPHIQYLPTLTPDNSKHTPSIMPEGRQSPAPENQSGRQQQDPPASGKGTDNAEGKGEQVKSELEVCMPRRTLGNDD